MEFTIIRSKRRTIAISVKSGKVILRAPMKLSDDEAKKIILTHQNWIEKKLEKAKTKAPIDEAVDDKKANELRKLAREYFKEKTEYYSGIMNLKPSRITITGARTRFGSCSSKGNLSFSYLLMLYPEAAREYVVVHELAHLSEMNHSKRFYAIIEKYMPDYKERKKLLKV